MLGYPERRTLEAVAETFFPGAVHAASRTPSSRPSSLRCRAPNDGGCERFSPRSPCPASPRVRPDRRERVLRAWCDSAGRAPARGLPGAAQGPADDRVHPAGHARLGADRLPRPAGSPGDDRAEARAAAARGRRRSTATSAWPDRRRRRGRRRPRRGGLDVVVLEAGGHYEDADFDGAELTACAASITAGARPRPTTRASASWPAPARRRHRRQLHDVLRTPDEIRAMEWGGSRRTRSAERSTLCAAASA